MLVIAQHLARPHLFLPVLSNLAYWRKVSHVQTPYLIGQWPLWEGAGRVAHDLTGRRVNCNVLYNPGFELAGGGGADVWLDWTETASDGAIADEAAIVHGGSHAAKLTTGASANTRIYQVSIPAIPGETITFTFWTRGDGVNAGRYGVQDETHAAWIRSLVTTGITGTDYTQVTYGPFTVPADCYSLRIDFWGPAANGGIAYFDDAALTWNRPLHGVYSAAGVTYGEPGIGDGRPSTKYSGVDTHAQIGNQAYSTLWNGNKGSAIAWGKMDAAGRWEDITTFRYLFHPKSRTSETVYLVMGKHTDNHTLFWRRRVAVGTYEQKYVFAPTGTLDWFCMGFVWDVLSAPKRFAGFLYTAEDDTWQKVFDEEPALGVEEWDNATYPVDNTNNMLMAGSVSAQEWIGWGARVACWAGVVLSDAEMQKVMVP